MPFAVPLRLCCSCRLGFTFGLCGFQIFQPQFQLLDLLAQFFRASPELHSPQLRDQQLQILDFAFVGIQLGLFFDQEGLFLEQQRVLFQHQQPQRFCIKTCQIRQYCSRHAPDTSHSFEDNSGLNSPMSSAFFRYCYTSTSGAARAHRPPPVNALKQHRQLCSRQRNAAAFCLRPDETSSLQALGEQTQSVAIEPQQFDQIAPPPAKDEHVSGKRTLFQNRLCNRTQSRESPPKIGHTGRDPDLCGHRRPDHRIRPSTAARTQSGSAASFDPHSCMPEIDLDGPRRRRQCPRRPPGCYRPRLI